jgi:hypothetical protein
MKLADLERHLRAQGCTLHRQGGSHSIWLNLETEMERDEDGVVLGSTRLPGSQRLHR